MTAPHVDSSVSERTATAWQAEAELYKNNLQQLAKIGMALSHISDFNELLHTILSECRRLLRADSGSIFLRLDAAQFPQFQKPDESDALVEHGKVLLFKEAQNDSIPFNFRELVMPVSKRSIAGYVAMTGESVNIADLYQLPAGAPYQFNTQFDKDSGYRSRSMLSIPMAAHDGEVLGVITLLNCKREFARLLDLAKPLDEQVEPFSRAAEELARAVASQAAVAIENNKLVTDIRKLFDSFVITSVKAIEARDPSTAGHSSRVSRLSVALAKAAHECRKPPFDAIQYSEKDMAVIRKAGLLHDFGKIGVREHVLCKPNKLYPHQVIAIMDRFRVFEKSLEIQRLAARQRLTDEAAIAASDKQFDARAAELRADLDFLMDKIKPTFLKDEDRQRILALGERSFVDEKGDSARYLNPDEIENLLIVKGSLNKEERIEIESHVSQSFHLLKKIPWTAEYKGMLEMIYYHHENVDGTGYPEGLSASQIPFGAMIIHIADIFDALVANDRPYKPAMPLEKALHILQLEAKDKHLDGELVNLFIEAQVFNVVKTMLTSSKADMNDGYV